MFHFSSIDFNECKGETHNCDPRATCLDTSGSFLCVCNNGWRGGGEECRSKAVFRMLLL